MLLAAGCCHPVGNVVDPVIRELAAGPIDVMPAPEPSPIRTVAADEPAKPEEAPKPQPARDRLQLPRELPGFDVPDIRIPPEKHPDRDRAIRESFPDLPALGGDAPPQPGPEGRPLCLADLQRIALTHNPTIRQAVARVQAARGTAVQVGLYPNPKVGYEGDTAGTAAGAGYQGGYIEQTVKTAGKLQLAQAAAEMDVAAAELALRAARNELITKVRANYFAALLAREELRVDRAVARLTEEMYRLQLDLLKARQAAAYEVLQFRAQAIVARSNLVEARNRVVATWKQLAATLGLPDLPPTEMEGRIDRTVPLYDSAEVLARVLEKHTDVLTAHTGLQRARYLLRLAEVTPLPDVDLRIMIQKDYTSPTFLLAHSVMVGVPVPIWDRNQGGIKQAQGELARASEEAQRARTDLRGRAAEVFERYLTSRQLVDAYRSHVLPDLVRVYRGVYDRYQTEPDKVNFNDVSTAQQNLVNAVNSYLVTLGTLWTAVVDVAGLLQTDDLFAGGKTECLEAVPDLEQLLRVPCKKR